MILKCPVGKASGLFNARFSLSITHATSSLSRVGTPIESRCMAADFSCSTFATDSSLRASLALSSAVFPVLVHLVSLIFVFYFLFSSSSSLLIFHFSMRHNSLPLIFFVIVLRETISFTSPIFLFDPLSARRRRDSTRSDKRYSGSLSNIYLLDSSIHTT